MRTLVAVAAVGVGTFAWALGTPGTLDPAFSGDGISLTGIQTTDTTVPVASVMDGQGRVVFAGYRRQTSTDRKGKTVQTDSWLVNRLNQDGDLDPTFSSDGIVDLFPGVLGQVGAQDVAVDDQDRVLLVGSVRVSLGGNKSRGDIRLVRLLANGNLDGTFGDSGAAALPSALAGNDMAHAVAVQPDGKILVGGARTETNSRGTFLGNRDVIARFLPGGALDTSYGSGGVYVSPAYVSGRIVRMRVDGAARAAVLSTGGVAVRSSTGSLLWQASNPFTSWTNSYVRDVAFDASGNVVVAGEGLDGVQSDMVAARFVGTTGALDTTFNGSGLFASGKTTGNTTWATSRDGATGLCIQSDGRVVLCGTGQFQASGVVSGILLRLEADGSYDATFGPGPDGPGVSQVAAASGVRFVGGSGAMRVFEHPTTGRLVFSFGSQDVGTGSYERSLATYFP